MTTETGAWTTMDRRIRWGAVLLFVGFLAAGLLMAVVASAGITALVLVGGGTVAAAGITGGFVLLPGDLGEAVDWWGARPAVLRAPEVAAAAVLSFGLVTGGSAPLYIRGILLLAALGALLLAVGVLGSLVDLVATRGPGWAPSALSLALGTAGIAISVSFLLQALVPEAWWMQTRRLLRAIALGVPLGLVAAVLGETTVRVWSGRSGRSVSPP